MTQTKTNKKFVFIGGKPFINYVNSIIRRLDQETNEVIIKARGKFISKSVDIAEIVKKKLSKDKNISAKNISIGSEEFKTKEGKIINVSTLDITIKKS
jgi:archaea-specific DNA-binding protein